MEARIRNGNNQTMKEILKLQHEGSWATENKKLRQNLGISEENIKESKYALKLLTQERVNDHFKTELEKNAQDKSKMKYFQEGKSNWKVRNRANYMNKLTRNQASTIFKTRTRMLKVKSNYKNGNKDLTCRMCGKHEETQDHILEECESINIDHPPVTKALIFSECIKELRKAAECITKRMEILENKE